MIFCGMAISLFQVKMVQLNPTRNKVQTFLLWLYIVIVGVRLTLTNTNPNTIDLGVIYGCTKVTPIGVFDYSPQVSGSLTFRPLQCHLWEMQTSLNNMGQKQPALMLYTQL